MGEGKCEGKGKANDHENGNENDHDNVGGRDGHYDVEDEVGDCGLEADDTKRRGSAAHCSAL